MAATKTAISLDKETRARVDRLGKDRVFLNRNRAIQESATEKQPGSGIGEARSGI